MSTKQTMEEDLKTLKKKVAEGRAKKENAEGAKSLRSLHKHLKRAQRKVRSKAARIAKAAGKKKAAA